MDAIQIPEDDDTSTRTLIFHYLQPPLNFYSTDCNSPIYIVCVVLSLLVHVTSVNVVL